MTIILVRRVFLMSLIFAACGSMAFGQESLPGVVQNQYFHLTADSSGQVLVRFDPTGEANYGLDSASICSVGTVPNGTAVVESDRIRVSGSQYIIRDVAEGGYPAHFDHGENLPSGGSLGQSFTVPAGAGWLHDVWALLTCSTGVGYSSVNMILRKDGPTGEVIATRHIQPLTLQGPEHLALETPVPPGVYYLEIRDKVGNAYWWGSNTDVYSGGTAFISGQAAVNKDLIFGYTLADVGVLDWEVRPVGDNLRCSFTVQSQAISGFNPSLALSFPWQRDGYDTTDPNFTPFRYLTTDTGYWFPVEAFKRLESDIFVQPKCSWARLRGTKGYDLKVQHNHLKFESYMEPDRMQVLIGSNADIQLLPNSDVLAKYFPRFFTSDSQVNDVLNRFLLTFLTSNAAAPFAYEFDGKKLSWVDGPIRDSFKALMMFYTYRIDEDGYIWSTPDGRGWDGSDASTKDTRHYDSNVCWLMGCWDYYTWTGDQAFLNDAIGTVRKATDYLLNSMDGDTGLLTINSPDHTGVTVPPGTTYPSGYFDIIPTGYRDAYINSYYAPVLLASAELERAAGNEDRAVYLEGLIALAKQKFNDTFWDNTKGRYVSWVDITGAVHDWGMTYVNTMAATYGLANQEQVQRMYNWMENEVTSSGSADTFSRWIFAARSNTIHCTDQTSKFPYDESCEDGGAIFFTAYYEIMSRARFLGADNAWTRFKQILARYDMPDHLVGGNPLYLGEIDNGYDPVGSVGVRRVFPESGIVPSAFLNGVVGVRADLAGLHIRPNLPSELTYAGVDGLMFRGRKLKITAYPTHITVEWPGRMLDLPVPPSGEIMLTPDMVASNGTYYVSATGNDSNTGLSESQAWATIDNGDKGNLLNPGDTVVVLSGTYNVSGGTTGVFLSKCGGTSTKPIKYVARGSVTINRGAGAGVAVDINGAAKYIVLDGFKITGGAPTLLVENNTMGNEIKNCVLSQMYALPNVACLLVKNSGNNSIHDNVIDPQQPNSSYGIQDLTSTSGDKFYNNTIISATRWAFLSTTGNVPVEFRNNIISSGTAYGGIYSDNTAFVNSNNILYGSFTYPYGGYAGGQGSNNLQVDPLFVNPAGGDYHLQSGSPAIDSGMIVGLSYQGSAPDRGAFESVGSPVTSTGSVSGGATDAVSGASLVGVTVKLLDAQSAVVAQTTTASDGHYAITANAGSYTMTASLGGYFDASGSAVIAADEAITVDFVLRTTAPKTYYVSPTGSDANTGLSESHAWATIDNGDINNVLGPGDSVVVLPGRYDVSLGTQAGVYLSKCGGTFTQPVVYVAQGDVTIDHGVMSLPAVQITGAARYIVLNGFKMIGGAPVVLIDNGTTGNEIKNCTLSQMNAVATLGCLSVRDSGNNSIHNNVVDPRQPDILSYGIQDTTSTGGDKFYNNTIIGVTRWAFLSTTGNVPVQFRNNIISSGTAYGGIYSDNTQFVHSNNIVYGSFNYPYGGYAGGQGSNNLQVDPLFVNRMSGDYRLRVGSPAIDSGLNVGLPYLGSAPDRGAFENDPTVTLLAGVVTMNSAGSPKVAGVTVETVGGSFTAVTDAKGVYSLALPAGNYTIRVSKTGLQPQQQSVSVVGGRINVRDYIMDIAINNVSRISEVRLTPDDGQIVRLISAKVVTVASSAFADGSIYIEEPDRSAGILVLGAAGQLVGNRITLTGTVGTNGNGEKYLQVMSIDSVTGGDPIGPLGMAGKNVQSTLAAGLFVKIWGRVTSVSGSSYCYVDDGSGISDGSGHVGVRVILNELATSLSSLPADNDYIAVTGVAGRATDGITVPVVRIRGDFDIAGF